jgi:RNA polymerase sigma-70 factor (ECF subfamily)
MMSEVAQPNDRGAVSGPWRLTPELEARLRRAADRLHLAFDSETFASIVRDAEAAVQHAVENETFSETLDRHLEDFVLARSTLRSHPEALSTFDAVLVREVRRAVTKLGLASDAVDEVAQDVRTRLLVGADGIRPRLASYSAAGSLAAWIRMSAVRTALNSRRPLAREVSWSEGFDRAADQLSPELALLRQRTDTAFREAFALAMERLSPRQRTLLRLHALEGLSLASIGTMYRRDASTVSRWLDAARATLLQETKAWLTKSLALDAEQLESLMRVFELEMSLSLPRLLQSRAPSSA